MLLATMDNRALCMTTLFLLCVLKAAIVNCAASHGTDYAALVALVVTYEVEHHQTLPNVSLHLLPNVYLPLLECVFAFAGMCICICWNVMHMRHCPSTAYGCNSELWDQSCSQVSCMNQSLGQGLSLLHPFQELIPQQNQTSAPTGNMHAYLRSWICFF